MTTVVFVGATAVFLAVADDSSTAQPVFWLFVGLHACRFGGRADAQHRHVDLRDAPRPRRPPRPRQRHGRHRHRRVLRRSRRCSAAGHRPAGGMGWALYVSLALTIAVAAHICCTIHIAEPEPEPAREDGSSAIVDVRGALECDPRRARSAAAHPAGGVNNLLGGVFMALMDAYGLSLCRRRDVGLPVGRRSASRSSSAASSCQGRARIEPGAHRAHRQPCQLDRVRHVHAALLDRAAGDRHVRLAAADPGDRGGRADRAAALDPVRAPGRVFGFAQLVENAAAPLTAILMAPLAEAVFMPFMTDGRGADWIGVVVRHRPGARHRPDLHARRPVIGIVVTLCAWSSRSSPAQPSAGRGRRLNPMFQAPGSLGTERADETSPRTVVLDHAAVRGDHARPVATGGLGRAYLGAGRDRRDPPGRPDVHRRRPVHRELRLLRGTNVYIGQAAHCSGTGGSTETDGCDSGSLPLGTPVDVGGVATGTMVYNSWLTMQAQGESERTLRVQRPGA